MTPRTTCRILSVSTAVLLALTGCGGGDDPTVGGGQAGAPQTPAAPFTEPPPPSEASLQGCVNAPPTGPVPTGATTELTQKPQISRSSEPPPCDLQVTDIVPGSTGQEAKTGDQLTVKYVGALYENGKEFDSSWSRGPQETFDFPLGGGQVIDGWDQGLIGMKVGGRRKLVIPPEQAYGPSGRPPVIPPNATLVFVVDLVKIN